MEEPLRSRKGTRSRSCRWWETSQVNLREGTRGGGMKRKESKNAGDGEDVSFDGGG